MKTQKVVFELKNLQQFDEYRKKEIKEIEAKINKGLLKMGASGLITFILDRNTKDIRKITWAGRSRMVFAINIGYIDSMSDMGRVLLLSKKNKWLKAGYTMDSIFQERDEQMQDFLAWIIESDKVGEEFREMEGYDFLSNLFQYGKME